MDKQTAGYQNKLLGAVAQTDYTGGLDCLRRRLRQSDHFIHSTPAVSVLFFSIIERSVLMALVFYLKYMLEKIKMQRTRQFSAFSLLPKEPS